MSFQIDEKIQHLLKKEKVQEALNELNKITPTDERSSRYLYMKKAKLALDLEQFFLADFYVLMAKDGIQKSKQYYQILSIEAKLALAEEDYPRVIACCDECFDANESQSGLMNLILGHALQRTGDYYGAIKNYQIVASTSPKERLQTASLYTLAKLYFRLGEFSLAELDIKRCIEKEKQKKVQSQELLMKAYILQGKYQEAKELLQQFKTQFPQDTDIMEDYEIALAKALGEPLPPRNKHYYSNQMIEYHKEEAIAHIKQNHGPNSNMPFEFNRQVNIDELFENVKIQMTLENMVVDSIYDTYEIAYQNIGYDSSGNILDRLRVVAVPGTKDIINMYPSPKEAIKFKSHLDDEKKTPTRIDKFNSRLAKMKK